MTAAAAIERIVALDDLTQKTGVATYKTRNTLLASLPPEVLVEVALELSSRKLLHRDNRTSNSKGTSPNVSSR